MNRKKLITKLNNKPTVFALTSLLLTVLSLTILNVTLIPSVNASPGTLPVGSIAVKPLDVPNGTPAGSQLGWQFNSFVANATGTSPTATAQLQQDLSADANKTVAAGSISKALSTVYADDDDPYRVPALNESGNLYFIAKFEMNITLDPHYIKNETWITALDLTVKGNASLTADTTANVYLYNFTGSSWVDLGTDLNATSKATLGYTVPSGKEAQFVDENQNNAIWLNYTWYDSTNTTFNVDIDYVKVTVGYNLDVSVGSWATTLTNSTVTVSAPGSYALNYWENCTLSAPSGVTDHNFTVYMKPPHETQLTNQKTYVNSSSVTSTLTAGTVAFNVTNLIGNSTALNFNAVMIDVARYESNPGTAFNGDIGKYIDVHLNSSTLVNEIEIEIRLYYTDEEVPEAGNPRREEELRMYYWDGTSWKACSNTGVNTAQNYIWAKITSTTTPSLSDLAGTPFGASSPEYPVGGTFGSVHRLFLLAKLAGQFIINYWPMLAGISMLIIGIFMLLYWRKK